MTQTLDERSNDNLILDDISQGQESAVQSYKDFLRQWWKKGLSRCRNRGLSHDDAQDVTNTTIFEFYLKTQKRGFEEKTEKELQRSFYNLLSWRITDHWRRQYRLNEWQEELSDEQVVADEAGTDNAQREYVVEIAEQCLQERLINEKQFELVRRRMLKEPLSKEWSKNWINTNWHRVKTIIKLKALKGLDDLSR